MSKYKYRFYEYDGDKLLAQFQSKNALRESDMYDISALSLLEYDGFAECSWQGNEKIWRLTERGEFVVKNGGYKKLMAYLDWNDKEKKIICVSIILVFIALFLLAQSMWAVAGVSFAIAVALWFYCSSGDKQYNKWIKSGYKWNIKIDD